MPASTIPRMVTSPPPDSIGRSTLGECLSELARFCNTVRVDTGADVGVAAAADILEAEIRKVAPHVAQVFSQQSPKASDAMRKAVVGISSEFEDLVESALALRTERSHIMRIRLLRKAEGVFHRWRSLVVVIANASIRVSADENELPMSSTDAAAGRLWTSMDLAKGGISVELAGNQLQFKSKRRGESCLFMLAPEEKQHSLKDFQSFLLQQLRIGERRPSAITQLAIGSAWFQTFSGGTSADD